MFVLESWRAGRRLYSLGTVVQVVDANGEEAGEVGGCRRRQGGR